MAKQASITTGASQTAAPAAPAAVVPAGFTPEMMAQLQAMMAGAAPKAAKVAAPAAPAGLTGVTVTVTQLGKSWSSKQGNAMIAVRGTLANGATVGGNLWIKL